MSTPEVPFEPDYQVTSEAYLRYCAGLAVAQTPFDTISIHHFDDVERDADNIWGIAENIMTSSIRSIIKAVHSPDSPAHAKPSYEQNLPFLFRALDAAFETHTDKITTINTWYPILRPAPFLHKPTYVKFTDHRIERIKPSDLMDGLPRSKIFTKNPAS